MKNLVSSDSINHPNLDYKYEKSSVFRQYKFLTVISEVPYFVGTLYNTLFIIMLKLLLD